MQNPNTIIIKTKRLSLRHQVIEDLDSLWTQGRAMTIEYALKVSND